MPHCGGVSSDREPDDGLGGSAGAPTDDAGAPSPDATAGSGGTSGGTGGGTGGGAATNLMPDPGFESGQGAWLPFGNARLEIVSEGCHTGSQCLRALNRTQEWEGPARRIEAMLTPGQTYELVAWVRSSEATPRSIKIATRSTCAGAEDTYAPMGSALVGDSWVEITGVFVAPTCSGNELIVYFEGAPPEAELFLDDVTLLPAD